MLKFSRNAPEVILELRIHQNAFAGYASPGPHSPDPVGGMRRKESVYRGGKDGKGRVSVPHFFFYNLATC